MLTISRGGRTINTVVESSAVEIHQVDIGGLDPGVIYKVTVSVEGAEPAILTLTTGLRSMRVDQFDGTTYFGIAHVDDMDALKKLGAGLVRYSPTWDNLEPTASGFDPAAVKRMVNDVAQFKAAGVEPLVLLCFSTDWAKHFTREQMKWRHPAFGPPDSVDLWKDYVRLVMTALKGQARYYEIWNEPDAGYLATGSASERSAATTQTPIQNIYWKNDDYWLGDRYVPLVTAAREVADEVDGDHIDLLGPSWNHDYSAIRGYICFARGLQRYLQMYSFHNYVGDPHSYALWEEMTNNQYFSSADALFKKYDAEMPIAVTEWGVRTYDDVPATMTGFHTRRDGQIFLVKSVFDYLAMQRVSILVLHQMGYNDEWSLLTRKADNSLIYHPMFYTYAWLCHTFGSKKYEKVPLDIDIGQAARGFAIRLTASGKIYIALWQNVQLLPSGFEPLPENTGEVILQDLPSGSYTMDRLDLMGQTVSSKDIESRGSYSWIESLPQASTAAESEPAIYRLTRK
jgi:hypothetical protein